MVSAFFDSIDSTLTQRCSSSIEVFVRFLDVHFSVATTADPKIIHANYTIQILPTVLQNIFYDLCGLTLKTMFDLRIPGATAPIKHLLRLSGDNVAAEGVGCPSMNATKSQMWQGFSCAPGEILRETKPDSPASENSDSLPECCEFF